MPDALQTSQRSLLAEILYSSRWYDMTDYFSSGISLKLYTLSLCLRRNLPSPLHMAFAWLTLVTQCK